MSTSPTYKVDPHFHLWDLTANYYPWLTDKVQPRVIGNYAAIRKNYLAQDFLADIKGSGVRKGVHIQAEHDPTDPVRETRWLQEVADDPRSQGFPHGIVAFADLGTTDAQEVVEAHCQYRNVRGIRQLLMQHRVDPAATDPQRSRHFSNNLTALIKHGLSFDLQLLHADMADGAKLAARHDDLVFVLTHTGLPMESSESYREVWRAGMKALAARPNVFVKISGFGFIDREWTLKSIMPLILETIDIFGVDRCMFASNFPVDSMSRSYREFWLAYEAATSTLSDSDRQQLFATNAESVYRI